VGSLVEPFKEKLLGVDIFFYSCLNPNKLVNFGFKTGQMLALAFKNK
jgi:hypothetical protein